MRLLKRHPVVHEAVWVGVTLRLDPVTVLAERDDTARAVRLAAAELITEARERERAAQERRR